jgi:hypothetical protein
MSIISGKEEFIGPALDYWVGLTIVWLFFGVIDVRFAPVDWFIAEVRVWLSGTIVVLLVLFEAFDEIFFEGEEFVGLELEVVLGLVNWSSKSCSLASYE